jgi:hypothetical protein
MWWLTFFGGDAVIIEAASLAHARLLAAALGRASHFAKLIFYSANSQAIERTFKSALEKRLGTTFRMIS